MRRSQWQMLWLTTDRSLNILRLALRNHRPLPVFARGRVADHSSYDYDMHRGFVADTRGRKEDAECPSTQPLRQRVYLLRPRWMAAIWRDFQHFGRRRVQNMFVFRSRDSVLGRALAINRPSSSVLRGETNTVTKCASVTSKRAVGEHRQYRVGRSGDNGAATIAGAR